MKKTIVLLAFICGFACVQGQQNKEYTSTNMVAYNASGGDALSNQGSVAYSLGGIFYSVIESPHTLVCEGVQQAEFAETEEEVIEEDEVVEEEVIEEEPVEQVDPVVVETSIPNQNQFRKHLKKKLSLKERKKLFQRKHLILLSRL
ncbi:hypothetical protein ACU8V7_15115 [Zobellia nedashkovskayae]